MIHGLLDHVMQLLELPLTKDGSGYYIEAVNGKSRFHTTSASLTGQTLIHITLIVIIMDVILQCTHLLN